MHLNRPAAVPIAAERLGNDSILVWDAVAFWLNAWYVHAAVKWRMKWMALDVFADNATALACYEACGFKIIRRDEPMRRLFGQRLRVTMAKPV